MCRAVTGDGLVKRTLYSDTDVTVLNYRRVLVVNGIDVGAVRCDLADLDQSAQDHALLAPVPAACWGIIVTVTSSRNS